MVAVQKAQKAVDAGRNVANAPAVALVAKVMVVALEKEEAIDAVDHRVKMKLPRKRLNVRKPCKGIWKKQKSRLKKPREMIVRC